MRRLWPWLVLLVVLLAVGGSLALRFIRRAEPPTLPVAGLRMAVVNACGQPYLAGAVARELEARGFVVYGVSNAAESRARTTVVDLLDPAGGNARLVAQGLSVEPRFWVFPTGERLTPVVEVRLDSSRYLEVAVLLGADYRSFFPQIALLR